MEGPLSYVIAILAILATIGVVIVLIAWKKRNPEKVSETNFRVFFIIGIILIPVGVGSMVAFQRMGAPFFIGIPLFTMGITYLIMGLANKDKWR